MPLTCDGLGIYERRPSGRIFLPNYVPRESVRRNELKQKFVIFNNLEYSIAWKTTRGYWDIKLRQMSRFTKFISVILLVSCLVCTVKSSVAGGSGTSSTERGMAVSLLDYDHILLPEETNFDTVVRNAGESETFPGNIDQNSELQKSEPISLDGFNLLWLVASKLDADDKLIRIEHGTNESSVTKPQPSIPSIETDITDEIYLNSAWPRPYLRYSKKAAPVSRALSVVDSNTPSEVPPPLAPGLSEYLDSASDHIPPETDSLPRTQPDELYDNSVVRINRFIAGNSIGFEMEFRVEEQSGSGYIITGRSLVGQSFFEPIDTVKVVNESTERQSWFGLYSQARSNSYILRLEYRNFAWHRKKQLQIRFTDNFRKGDWQKLAVNIDFEANTINYWVNCSARPLVQLRGDITHPSSFYSVYRLVQHRRRSSQPVKVTFREAVVTDGHRRVVPRQCEDGTRPACIGGKVYMPCGPSCERTCRHHDNPEMSDDYLRTCAIACVSGCHCRPGYVSHNGVCVKPQQCPCMIGTASYESGRTLTINNERCTCVSGQWSCYHPPELTKRPRNMTIMRVGRSNQLSCGVSGNPQPVITWEAPEGSSYRIVAKNYDRLSILVLLNVTEKEAGIYRCRASLESTGWEMAASAVIKVISKPVISLPQTVPATRGHPILSIDCMATGLPRPRIWWRRKGRLVLSNDRIEIYRGTPGVVRLKIHDVQSSDAGEWACHATSQGGQDRKTARVLVRLPEPSSMAFYRTPVDQYVKRGHTAMFHCEIISQHSSTLNMTWLKDGVRVDLTGKRIVTKRYRLIIRQVKDEDAGIYTCVVRVGNNRRELRAKAELMIKGQMLPWSEWSHCSATCDGGIMFKRRTCTGIPPNEKTCHGKFTHIRPCNMQICPGICSAIGDPHYTTFDGRKFNFHGDCGYVLSHDATGNDFKVLLYNGDCGMGLSCLSSVTAILSMTGLTAVIDVHNDSTVAVNSVTVSLPYTAEGTPLVIDKVGLYIIVNAGEDFELKWALPHRLYLTVGPKYKGRTQGFCGNYNGDPTDDNIIRSGRSVESDIEFGLDWAVQEGNVDHGCLARQPRPQPCYRDHNLGRTATEVCSFILDRESFGTCHTKVSPVPYIEACKFDICRTSIKRTNVYFCTALSAYAEECLRNGLVLNWRTNAICPEECYYGKAYEECGPRCVRYCPGIVNESGRVCTSNERCVSGCHCPRDTVLHNNRCIPLEQCPCVERGLQYENNTSRNRDCEKCVCLNGKWKCAFNKDLCEFPAAVINGPLSQVVPSGRSVSFCCQAAGIPPPTVEWYREGRLIPPQSSELESDQNHIGSRHVPQVHGYAKADLTISNLTKLDSGSYHCKATNSLGTQISEVAMLTVVEPWMTTCNPVPSKRLVNLPEGCQYRGENVVNVGYCPSLPCFYEGGSRSIRRKNKCGGTKQCCRPSAVQPVSITCNQTAYSFSFHVSTVTECGCSICESRYTIVEGALATAVSDNLLKHVKIDYQGRVVGYTTDTGSFNLRFFSLPDDARHVTLTFTDIMHKRFPATVKNLPIIVGETTTHKVIINGEGVRVPFYASRGLKRIFRSSTSRRSERLRLIIPPSSLILQQADEPYVGKVEAVVSIVERDYEIDERKLHTVPGNFVGVDLQGSKQILLPSYVISVSMFSQLGRPLELLPDKAATFLVNTVSFGKKMQPWVLDELTGLWRERNTKVHMEPNFNKRGEKVLQLTAKIPRLNTAWALSDSEEACYVRVRTLDNDNNTVAGVRVVMTTTDKVPRHGHGGRSRRTFSSPTQMQTLVESLTRSTDVNGVCMPIGCSKFGFISAAKLANELSPLPPEEPPTEMGSIASLRSPRYGVTMVILQTLNIYDSNFLEDFDGLPKTSTALYFQNEEECKGTAADRRTYIFRDKTQREPTEYVEASRKAASRSVTRVAPLKRPDTFVRRSRTYCHTKIAVIMPEQVSYHPRRTIGALMILEAVTFSGRNSTDSMSTLGWRRAPFRAPVRKMTFTQYRRYRLQGSRTRPKRVTKELCVEYVCGDEDPPSMVYINVKQAKDGYTRGSEPLECRFIRAASALQGTSTTRTKLPSEKVSGTFSKGGYVYLPTENRSRYSRTRFLLPELSFPSSSLNESKKMCHAAHGTSHISAWVACS